MKFTEEKLEQVFIELLGEREISHVHGSTIERNPDEVLIDADLKTFLLSRYKNEQLTENEANQIIRQLKSYAASDLYESNKAIMKLLSDRFILKREDRTQKDLHIQLIDYNGLAAFRNPDVEQLTNIVAERPGSYGEDKNIYKFVNQLEMVGFEKRIPDGVLYINGLPLIVFEFKTAIRENCTIHDAYVQLTIRYKRDIPELFKYNAFCVISDGVNSKAGSFFAPYEFYYAWRKTEGLSKEVDGIDSMYTLIQGMFEKNRLRDIIRSFDRIGNNSRFTVGPTRHCERPQGAKQSHT